MKIVMPEEYRGRFESEKMWIKPKGGVGCIVQNYTFVFITLWRGHSLLFMNGEERNQLVNHLDAEIARGGKNKVFSRLVRAGLTPVMFLDGAVEVPEALMEWLGDGELNYKKDDWGIVVSGEKSANATGKTKVGAV